MPRCWPVTAAIVWPHTTAACGERGEGGGEGETGLGERSNGVSGRPTGRETAGIARPAGVLQKCTARHASRSLIMMIIRSLGRIDSCEFARLSSRYAEDFPAPVPVQTAQGALQRFQSGGTRDTERKETVRCAQSSPPLREAFAGEGFAPLTSTNKRKRTLRVMKRVGAWVRGLRAQRTSVGVVAPDPRGAPEATRHTREPPVPALRPRPTVRGRGKGGRGVKVIEHRNTAARG